MANMEISKKPLLRKVINCFENDSGKEDTDYSTLYIYPDGPNNVRQITLGFGITEYGNMRKLIQIYVNENGIYAENFAPYIPKIGVKALVGDSTFKALLIKASKEDAVFRAAEDKIFEEKYYAPAQAFFEAGGFTLTLSMMCFLDSFIHSGSIPAFLRSRFPEKLPSKGGDEKEWITQYVNVRHNWLAHHSRAILRGTVYRTQFFKNQIAANNWDLNPPIQAHDTKILS